MSSGLWIYLLEAGVALAIFAFIVWWTLPTPSRGERDAGPDRREIPPR